MSEDVLKGKWQEIKGEIQNVWGKLTNDELESVKGNLTSIAGLIHQRYGEAKDAVSEKLHGIMRKAGEEAVDKTEKAKQALRESENPRQY